MKTAKLVAVAAVAFVGVVAGTAARAQTVPTSPLAEYVGLGHNPDIERSIFDAEETARQDSIQKCMNGVGMPFVPLAPDFNVFEPGSDEPEEYFGFVTSFSRDKLNETGLVVRDDPNIVYAESLDSGERSRYYEALYGRDWQNPSQSAEDFAASCTGAAYRMTPGLAVAIAPLRIEYMAARASTLESDPRVSRAIHEWADCMSSNGFDVSSLGDMLGQLDQAIDAEIDETLGLSHKAYAELLELERAMYEANASCDSDLRPVFEKAIFEFDYSFLAEHEDELAQFRRDLW